MCLVIQLLVHIPFLYYIGKEHILIAYDEYINENLTLIVDRVRNKQGDPRHYLVEEQSNKTDNILKGLGEKVVFLHRLPHMKMSKRVLNGINIMLFSVVIILALTWEYSQIIFFVFSSILACLD